MNLEEIWVYIHEKFPMMYRIMENFLSHLMMIELWNLIYTEYPDKWIDVIYIMLNE